MKIIETGFSGLYVLEAYFFSDERGRFLKPFQSDVFHEKGLECAFQEAYYSVSGKNVIRGMHFQIPPFDHAKFVYVSKGSVLDVAVDLRKNSPTYGVCHSVYLDDQNGRCVYIPKGFAHGFVSLEDESFFHSLQTSCYSKEHERGVLFSSLSFDWEIDSPIVSEKDMALPKLENINSPF